MGISAEVLNRKILQLLAAAGAAIACGPADASILSWNNAAGGSAAVASNWSPGQVPVAGDVLNFALASSYTTTFNASVSTSAQLNFGAGLVTLTASSPHNTTSQFVVGRTAGQGASVNIMQGQFGTSGIAAIGANATASGTLTVSSAAAVFRTAGASSILAVGNNGPGTLNINNGGLVLAGGPVFVSRLAGSSGTVNIVGSVGAISSTLQTTDPATGDITVAQGGNGTINVTDGARIDCARDLIVAPTAGFVGQLLLDNTSSSLPNTVFAGHEIHIGHNATSAPAGDGTLLIRGSSAIETSVTPVFVGDPNGGYGTLTIEGAAAEIGSLICDPVNSTVNITAESRLTVRGGPFAGPANLLIDSINPALPSPSEVLCTFGGSGLFPIVTLGATTVGGTGRGSLTLDPCLITANGDIVLGRSVGSSGILQTHGSLAFPGRVITVGRAGFGEWLGNFSTLSGGSIAIATSTSGSGSAVVGASGCELTGGITIGRSGSSNPAFMSLSIGLSATVGGDIVLAGTVARFEFGGNLTAPAIRLNGASSVLDARGTIAAPVHIAAQGASIVNTHVSSVSFRGPIVLDPGVSSVVISGPSVIIDSTGSFTGAGAIDAPLQTVAGSFLVATGPLLLGSSSSPSGTVLQGQLLVQNNSVTLRDSDVASVTDVAINGGTLVGPVGGVLLNGTLSGTGGVTTPVFLNRNVGNGEVRPVGLLSFNGNYSQALAGPASAGGTLRTDVASVNSFNRIAVTGTATLGGTLTASFIGTPANEPPIGTTFTILTAGSINGTFETVDTPGFEVDYTSTSVRLRWIGINCPPDFNNDGSLDPDDLADFIGAFFAQPAGAGSDFNSDGTTDPDDLADFIGAFFDGCGN